MGLFNGARRAAAAAAQGVARFIEAAPPARLVESGSEGDPPSDHPPAGASVRDDDAGWTRLSGRIGQRDLLPLEQTRMQELAAYVWEANPLANRLVELPVAFLIGEGVRLEAEAPEAQEWLEAFWHDPINAMDLRLADHMRELALFGEQVWPVLGNDVTGTTRLGKVDPSWITAIIVDPENPAVVIGVETRDPVSSGQLRRRRVVYAGAEADLFSEAAQILRAEMTDGDCFYWRINALSSGLRGRSDLLPALDHVDAHEQLLFGEVERATVLRSVLWDVKMTGATEEQVTERARTIQAPTPLSVRVHNEAEEWNLLTPTLNSADAGEAARLIRNHALGGATIPEFWMADGGNVNLATASSMGEPTYKVFLMRQRLWRAILEDLAGYVIRRRLAAVGLSQLAAEPSYKPKAVFPELTAKDLAKFSTVFTQVVAGAVQAVQMGVLGEESAVRLVVLASAALGLEVDAKEEWERAKADHANRAEGDVFRDPPPANPFAPPGAAPPAKPPAFPEDGRGPREP